MDALQIDANLDQKHKDALQKNGASIVGIIQWIEKTAAALGKAACSLKGEITVIVNELPNLNAEEKAAILAVLTLMCP